jgi:ketosteroid isomerase-like protein
MQAPVELFIRHVDMMAAADVDGLNGLYTEAAFYYDPLSGKLTGAAQIAPYLASIGEYFDSLTVDVDNAWAFNDHAAIEWIQRTWRDGKETTMRGMALIGALEGKIAEHRDFFTLGRPDPIEQLRRHMSLPT